MTKVTYLFGAGASVGTEKRPELPVVDQLPARIEFLNRTIKANDLWLPENDFFKNLPNKSKKSYQLDLMTDWEWLSDAAAKHASVDTLAKKLFLKGEKASDILKRLKTTLSMFFIFEQTRVSPDIRYDAFFASILKDKLNEFPQSIRIIDMVC